MIRCTQFLKQRTEVDDFVTQDGECYMIKLRKGHVSIDFLIFDNSTGTADGRALYFVLVSGQSYQSRKDRKFHSVLETSPTLNHCSPYDYYIEKFQIRKGNAFYVYSSPSIPSSDTFTTKVAEKTLIYFHHLGRSIKMT